jgi:hypothetical protein
MCEVAEKVVTQFWPQARWIGMHPPGYGGVETIADHLRAAAARRTGADDYRTPDRRRQELPRPRGRVHPFSAVMNLTRGRSCQQGGQRRPGWAWTCTGANDWMLEGPGVTTDYQAVRRNALAVDLLLEQAREIRFTTADGCDVTMKLCGRKGKAQTGFADEPGRFSGLPDGESTVAPMEGSTQGCIVNPYIIDKIGRVDEPFRM